MPRRRSPATKPKGVVRMCSGCGKSRNACSCLEDMLAEQLAFRNLPEPVRQYKFHKTRRWKSDFFFPTHNLIVECEGGIHLGKRGGHTSAAGYTRDTLKYNAMTIMGLRLLRFTGAQIRDGEAIAVLEDFFSG